MTIFPKVAGWGAQVLADLPPDWTPQNPELRNVLQLERYRAKKEERRNFCTRDRGGDDPKTAA